MDFNLDNFSPNQIKELLPIMVQQSELHDFEEMKNIYTVIQMMAMKTPVFLLLHKYYELFGEEEYLRAITSIEDKIAVQKKTAFLNLILEPKHMSEQTMQILENRHQALEMYKNNRKAFGIFLEFEPENYYDSNAIAVFATGKKDRFHIGYISRSFNLRIGELLRENEFPFIQTNYEDIINATYSEDNLVIDIYF